MVSLIDIAPLTEKVSVRGQEIEVRGVSAEGIAFLIRRFPEVGELISGSRAGKTVDFASLQAVVPKAVVAIIAAGCGFPGNEKAEKSAASLSLDEQVDLFNAIVRLTLPNGVGPFVQKLAALGKSLGVAGGPCTEQGTKSQKPSKN